MSKTILAIETSCDETAIAIAEFSGSRAKPQIKILSNIVSSQVKLHAKFGGVVPNLAKREHQKNLVPILIRALKESGFYSSSERSESRSFLIIKSSTGSDNKHKILDSARTIKNLKIILEREPELFARIGEYLFSLKPPKINAIAVTYGPGLAPALWVGINFAKALAVLWNKPLIPINHMAGHLYSALLDGGMWKVESGKKKLPSTFHFLRSIKFPAIALLVSGGHTELVLMKGYGKHTIIGETLDDAAGEAFDKVARMLGLKYPGGPQISALAEISQTDADKTPTDADSIRTVAKKSLPLSASSPRVSAFKLPRPMLNSKDYNFSFSGLKTAVLYLLQDRPEFKRNKLGKAAVAREFQNAVVDVLVSKTIRAAKEFNAKTILLGGGVAANKLLRQRLAEEINDKLPGTSCRLPVTNLTGDNALMIALAAYFSKNKKTKNLQKISAHANLRLDSEINI